MLVNEWMNESEILLEPLFFTRHYGKWNGRPKSKSISLSLRIENWELRMENTLRVITFTVSMWKTLNIGTLSIEHWKKEAGWSCINWSLNWNWSLPLLNNSSCLRYHLHALLYEGVQCGIFMSMEFGVWMPLNSNRVLPWLAFLYIYIFIYRIPPAEFKFEFGFEFKIEVVFVLGFEFLLYNELYIVDCAYSTISMCVLCFCFY